MQAHAKQAERDVVREREKLWKEARPQYCMMVASHVIYDV